MIVLFWQEFVFQESWFAKAYTLRKTPHDMKPGSRLEEKVKVAVEELICSGGLGLDPKYCKVCLHPSYFSKDRNTNLTFDVSIELKPPGTSEASLVWVWECKDYSGSVPVGDVEEFHAKLEQIGADMTKGTMITTGYYQRSAIEYARSKGIGLTRLLDGKKVYIVPGHAMYGFMHKSEICIRFLEYEGGKLHLPDHIISLLDPFPTKENFFSLSIFGKGFYETSLFRIIRAQALELKTNWDLSLKQSNPIFALLKKFFKKR